MREVGRETCKQSKGTGKRQGGPSLTADMLNMKTQLPYENKISPDSPVDIYLATHQPHITKHCSQASKQWCAYPPLQTHRVLVVVIED
jgi:hypothetical protein